MQGSPVRSSTLLDVSGAVPDSVIKKLLQACKTDRFDRIESEVTDSIADGWPVRLSAKHCTASYSHLSYIYSTQGPYVYYACILIAMCMFSDSDREISQQWCILC